MIPMATIHCITFIMKKIRELFFKSGYLPEVGIFIMSTETPKKEKCTVDDTIKMQWKVDCLKKHKHFEVKIQKMESEFLSNAMFTHGMATTSIQGGWRRS